MINIFNLIKGLEGNEFYSPLFGKCIYKGNNKYITESVRAIEFTYVFQGERRTAYFTETGRFIGKIKRENSCFIDDVYSDECLLFPSKEQRDWNKFIRPKEPLKENTLVYYKIYKNEIEWKVGFYRNEGSIYIMKNSKEVNNIRNAEVIIPINKINQMDLSYYEYDNYGMKH